MKKLIVDFETRSVQDIKKVGAFAYARHASTEILCLAYAEPGKKPQIIKDFAHYQGPQRWDGYTLVAHSAHFEWAIWEYILRRRYGWPDMRDPSRWSCTLSRAVACGLPASLENAGAALGLAVQKDISGKQAMLKLCAPVDFDYLSGVPIYREEAALKETLYQYCLRDVETEVLLDAALPELPAQERKIWELDLVMNHRGVAVDVPLCQKAAALGDALVADLNDRLKVMTGGKLDSATRVQAMKDYLIEQGVTGIDSLDKPAILALLARADVPQALKDVLNVRRQVGKKTSVAKYKAMVEAADPLDGRVRGALQYHAAHTGRWGGRLIQPQNFPKGFNTEAEQTKAIAALQQEDAGFWFPAEYGIGAMQTLSDSLRGALVPGPGKKFIGADFNAIEARVLFWEADDAEALASYKRGDSPYVDMARYIFKNPKITKKTHPKDYDLGKRIILGGGYGMGFAKFKATCKIQADLDVSDELAETAVKAYREKYRSVVSMWYQTERAAIAAVKNPGTKQPAMGGKVAWGLTPGDRFLRCKLPSGRFLRYLDPTVEVKEGPRGPSEELRYWAEHDPQSKKTVYATRGKMAQYGTYGGALVENVTQAVARDLMASGMINCEAAGYRLVLTVHDELLAEVDLLGATGEEGPGKANVDRFMELMCRVPKWAEGVPLSAEGWVGGRYRK